MNRNEILKKINYNGEYTKETKKKLRELLKKYHPDHYKKESDTFKLISSIKKELDSGKKISITVSDDSNIKNDNDYKISEEIIDLSRKRDNLINKKDKIKKELSKLQDDYRTQYDKDVHYRNETFDSTNEIIELQSKRQKYNVLLVIAVIISVIFIFTKWYYPLIITLILFIYAIYNYVKIEIDLVNKLKSNSDAIKVSEKNIKRVRSINDSINDLYKKIWDLDCEINRLNTRINLLKAKIR